MPNMPLVALLVLTLVACGGSVSEDRVSAPGSRQLQVVPLAFESLEVPAGPGALAPELTSDGERVWLSWLEPAGDEHRLRAAVFTPATARFDPPVEIVRGADFFANWADRPSVVSLGGDRLVAHWLARLGDSVYAYGVEVAASADGGSTWDATGLLHDDRSPQEHGFVSWLPLPDGTAYAAWIDGGQHEQGGAMQLRAARVSPRGEPFEEQVLDPHVCECCATGAALTTEGPVVVYRGRTEDEIRDIWRVLHREGGWGEPALVAADGWEITGCPVNGPQIAADGDRVVVAWFTAAEGRPRVRVAFSDDFGESFGEPVNVDSDGPVGRVDVVWAGESAIVTWLGSAGGETGILARRVTSDGALGTIHSLASTSPERASGFPRLARAGDSLLWAWIEPGDPARLRAAVTPVTVGGSP